MNYFTKVNKTLLAFIILPILLIMLIYYAMTIGGLKLSFVTILKGLFITYNRDVAIIYDIRFPRILVSLLTGSAYAISGTLIQVSLRNDLADSGLIGISSGANVMALLASLLFPESYLFGSVFAFIGGLLTFLVITFFAWRHHFSAIKLLLVGIALNSFLIGLGQFLTSLSSITRSNKSALMMETLSQKTWHDIHWFAPIILCVILLSLSQIKNCKFLMFDDKLLSSLGVNTNKLRLKVSFLAVLLAALATALVGLVSFLGLIVPHIGRLIIGNRFHYLIPFYGLCGAFLFLLADTIGRSIFYPLEISPIMIMNIIGGPIFILLLTRSKWE
ncbi:hypothetical protein HMPREF9318_00288 [Streptococcus urinalis FB127-CNA-2]|uniref:Probable heme-iron transport system permease protein IsdF n=1 Tax=Streptococcus urinalis 2285-97 TaxID=764291 RepID=G5KFM7_9STRE|nr:iron ABC transporter permease [Streptococcus urinalis]EHJ57283.1 iron chelate uptake ABC transporter, FeCT family, permease protein [Streptococcus urinalis 2285-97]EKS22090.1 hypothetical protein HMPREF9318_00288 [Streptococcus urinalis FB127-CNA-2]VEF31902.1 iron chelate uptake ABC transporter, FeCT family, permease protein [Streptococcus urinalis]